LYADSSKDVEIALLSSASPMKFFQIDGQDVDAQLRLEWNEMPVLITVFPLTAERQQPKRHRIGPRQGPCTRRSGRGVAARGRRMKSGRIWLLGAGLALASPPSPGYKIVFKYKNIESPMPSAPQTGIFDLVLTDVDGKAQSIRAMAGQNPGA
jgi:hypothetical protein